MKRIIPFFLLSLLVFTACGTSGGDAFRPDEPLAITAKVAAEAGVQGKDNTTSVGGTLRMRRDEIIQLSLTKFGIEGARVLFSPDSLSVIDRMNNRYVTTTYEQFSQLLGGQTLTFAEVQAFFWNDRNQASESVNTMIAAFINLRLNVERKNFTRIRDYRIAGNTQLQVSAAGKGANVGFKLSKIKINYGWKANTKVPSGYQKMDTQYLSKLLPKLIGKF